MLLASTVIKHIYTKPPNFEYFLPIFIPRWASLVPFQGAFPVKYILTSLEVFAPIRCSKLSWAEDMGTAKENALFLDVFWPQRKPFLKNRWKRVDPQLFLGVQYMWNVETLIQLSYTLLPHSQLTLPTCQSCSILTLGLTRLLGSLWKIDPHQTCSSQVSHVPRNTSINRRSWNDS